MKFSNKHDQRQADGLMKTLAKAKEQAETLLVYIDANKRPMEERWVVADVLENVNNSLERLGVEVTV